MVLRRTLSFFVGSDAAPKLNNPAPVELAPDKLVVEPNFDGTGNELVLKLSGGFGRVSELLSPAFPPKKKDPEPDAVAFGAANVVVPDLPIDDDF